MIDDFLKYLKYEKRFSGHTITSYRTDVSQFIQFHSLSLGSIDWAGIELDHIRSFVVNLMGQGLSPRTVNRKIASIRSFFRFLEREGIVDGNPCKNIKNIKSSNRLPSFIIEKDISKLLDELPKTSDHWEARERLVIELLYGTGMRLSELISLKENDINHSARTVRVLGKGNKVRIIPITKKLLSEIELYSCVKKKFVELKNNYLIVRDDGKKCYPMLIQRIVKKHLRSVDSASMKSPHAMRHSYATHLLNRGADLNAVKELLGHSSLSATQIYTHNSMDKLKSIFRKAHPKA